MHTIDIQNWSRREHFEFFKTFNHQHFNMCANVDLTRFLPYVRGKQLSFTIAIVYVITRAANAVAEFRQRIRADAIIEHDTVSPAITILLENELFSFCTFEYCQDFSQFASQAARQIAAAKTDPSLKDPPGRDDLLFMTAIPWVSFTSFTHPMRFHPEDSVPRFAWGKYFEDGGYMKMPLSVQGHHMLMDGIHMGKLYAHIEMLLEHPAATLENG